MARGLPRLLDCFVSLCSEGLWNVFVNMECNGQSWTWNLWGRGGVCVCTHPHVRTHTHVPLVTKLMIVLFSWKLFWRQREPSFTYLLSAYKMRTKDPVHLIPGTKGCRSCLLFICPVLLPWKIFNVSLRWELWCNQVGNWKELCVYEGSADCVRWAKSDLWVRNGFYIFKSFVFKKERRM